MDEPEERGENGEAGAPKARMAVCQEHGLRYDPTVHEGCIRCRSAVAAAAAAEAAARAPTDGSTVSPETHLARSRVMATLWLLGMVLVVVLVASRVGKHEGTSGPGPELEGTAMPQPPAPGEPGTGKGMVNPEPWKNRITGLDAAMDSRFGDYRSLVDATLNFGTELAERIGPSKVAGMRLVKLSQSLPADPDARRIAWRRFRDENFILADWFRNGPPPPEKEPPPPAAE